MADSSASPVHLTPLAALSSIITAIPSAREPGRVAALSRCGSPVVPPSTQAAGTSATMSGKKNRRAPSATPWDDLPESQIAPSQAIVKAARDGICSFRRERFSGDANFFNGYPRSERPHCGSAKVKRNGVQVYRCLFCGRTSTPIAGTIFDDSKLPVTAWADFILQALLRERGLQRQAAQGTPRRARPARAGQPPVLPAEVLPEGALRLQQGQHPGLPQPVLGRHEPTFRQTGEGRVRAGSGDAMPENAALPRLLQRKDQVRWQWG